MHLKLGRYYVLLDRRAFFLKSDLESVHLQIGEVFKCIEYSYAVNQTVPIMVLEGVHYFKEGAKLYRWTCTDGVYFKLATRKQISSYKRSLKLIH